jgi:hypothetical protein
VGETERNPTKGSSTESGEDDPSRIQIALAAAGGLAAAGAYVYLLGGFVLWLKFTAAQLPTDETVRLLDSNRLLAVGIKALVFELGLLALLLGLALTTWLLVKRIEPQPNEEGEKKETAKRGKVRAWKLVLNAVIVAVLVSTFMAELSDERAWVVVAVSLLLALFWTWLVLSVIEAWVRQPTSAEERDSRRQKKRYLKTGLTLVAVVVAIFFLSAPAGFGLLVLLLFLHLSHIEKKLPSVKEPRSLVVPVLAAAAGLSLVVVSYLATPPVALDRASLFLEGGGVLRGGYVGQTGEGIFLATCRPRPTNPEVSKTTKLRMVPSGSVRRMVLGGPRYILDYGKDPSLADVVVYLFERDSIQELLSTVSLDVRDSKPVCGLRRILVIPDPGVRLRSRLRIWVAGAGAVDLSGSEIRPRHRQVARRGYLYLRLLPKRWVVLKRGSRCQRAVRADVEVQFRLHDGDIDRRSARVAAALPPPRGRYSGRVGVACARPASRSNA